MSTIRSLSPRERLAFALDVANEESARAWLSTLADTVALYKVGLELFTSCGPEVVRLVTSRAACFLDLKLHDIPNTMAGAARAAAGLGVRYLTVHAAAGAAALNAARRAVAGSETRLLAVTVLTSMDEAELNACGVPATPRAHVLALAAMALDAGIDGFVCSPSEARVMRETFPDALLVTPGVRPAGTDVDDQRRAATPQEALGAGADILVVGRPIRDAADPAGAAAAIVQSIETATP